MGKGKESEIVESIEDEFVHNQLAILVSDDQMKLGQCGSYADAQRSFDQYLIARFVEIEGHPEYQLNRIVSGNSLVAMENMIGRC